MLLPNTPKWKIILIAVIIIIAILINAYCLTHAKSEDDIDCWILCQPNSWVNARMYPKKKSEEIGRLECGDKITTDGKIKNGFLHVYNLNFELSEGWVHKGYIVYDEPYKPLFIDTCITSNGRVSARKTINGKRRCWVKDGQAIKVYMMSEEWSVTNKGFIKTKFIDTGR
jgi:hypothetical protein